MSILTAEDLAFFHANGYIRVPQIVPQENLDAVITMIWDFLGMSPDQPDDWYRPPLSPGGMLEVYQHQALWDNRQYPRLHQAFSEIFGMEKLWVSFDRVNFKPPRHPDHPDYDHKGFTHWDTNTLQPRTFGVQGVLYLTDTTEEMGGFQCVPDLFRDFDQWVKTQPADRNPHVPDLTGYTVKPIPGKAGDLVIWDKWLAHGNGHNISDQPRFAQYISMFPAGGDEEWRQTRIQQWQERQSPQANWALGDPRHWEQTHGHVAELTPMGRKLLGLDLWD